ncbi:hypothetical protein P4533_09045 [Geobacillus stearothermophilus]|uniref:hypothetical protein n=1 Tax=Geobacillus stearothermophilus TaxID=1422 RepID=UPI002E2460E7|nr:hypothetical protein [Geobacillus stearothermophilus]
MTFAFFYRASLGGPDERREQKFATLVGDHFGMSPTNILLTRVCHSELIFYCFLACSVSLGLPDGRLSLAVQLPASVVVNGNPRHETLFVCSQQPPLGVFDRLLWRWQQFYGTYSLLFLS